MDNMTEQDMKDLVIRHASTSPTRQLFARFTLSSPESRGKKVVVSKEDKAKRDKLERIKARMNGNYDDIDYNDEFFGE